MASSSFNLSLASTVDDSLADSFPSDKDSSTSMVNNPEPDHPLRADLADKFSKDKKFFKNAEEFTLKNSTKRPMD